MSGTARFTKLTQNQLEHCRVGLVAEAEACQVGASVIGSDLSLYWGGKNPAEKGIRKLIRRALSHLPGLEIVRTQSGTWIARFGEEWETYGGEYIGWYKAKQSVRLGFHSIKEERIWRVEDDPDWDSLWIVDDKMKALNW